jgi:enolase-phosphatase E1
MRITHDKTTVGKIMIKAIITDIEGTTTDINFVHQVLFPYSKQKLPEFVLANKNNPKIMQILDEVQSLANLATATHETLIKQLLIWIEEDKKITPLKALQGYIWQDGFERNEFKSHLYSDAFTNLLKWHHEKIKLYVYSSGSVKGQRLLFQHSIYGDLTYLFDNYFDTEIGGKKDPVSYAKIIASIPFAPEETVFLSDVEEELNAAEKNGIKTVLLNRDNLTTISSQHKECYSFNEINLAELA